MQNIKYHRIKLNMTQDKLSKILKCERSSISKWERGHSKPSLYMLPKLAKALNCSIDDLFDSQDNGDKK